MRILTLAAQSVRPCLRANPTHRALNAKTIAWYEDNTLATGQFSQNISFTSSQMRAFNSSHRAAEPCRGIFSLNRA